MSGWYAGLALSLAVPLAGLGVWVIAFVWKGWRAALGVAAVGMVYVAVSYWPHVAGVAMPPDAGMTRIAYVNARIHEAEPALQARELVTRMPDVIALVEVRREWERLASAPVFKDYPYHAVHALGWNDGNDVALLVSRWPLTFVGKPDANGEEPALYRVDAPVPFHVMVIHPMAPLYARAYEMRNAFLVRLGQLELPERTVVVGDFNTVPWDPAMLPVWTRRDMERHFTWLPTYRTDMPAVPIDHVLSTLGIEDVSLRRWSDGQSDHFGLVVDFRVSE